MPDKDFETQVQQKMGELKFAPSDAVWQKVEKEIAERKKRRLIFLWLPLAFLLLGGSAWLFTYNENDKLNKQISKERTAEKTNNKDTGLPEKRDETSAAEKDKRIVVNNESHLAIKKNSTGKNKEFEKITKTTMKTVAGKAPVVTPGTPVSSIVVKNKILAAALKPSHPEKNEKFTLKHASPQQPTSALVVNKTKQQKSSLINKPSVAEKNTDETEAIIPGESIIKSEITKKPEELIAQSPVNKIIAKDSIGTANKPADTISVVKKESQPDSSAAIAKQKQPASTRKKILFGITAGAGISNVTDWFPSLFAVRNTSANSYYYSGPSSNITGSTNNTTVTVKPSDTKQGFAFGAGMFVNRQLKRNWKVTATIQYNYYSAKIAVGQKVDSSNAVNQGTVGLDKSVDSYYRTTSSGSYNYTNGYHFIGISPAIEKQLGSKSRISLNTGFTLARMLASNALQYNAQKNIYYKDNSLFNKTQVSLFAGANYRLLQKTTLLEVGPQFSYGLTNLFKNDLYGNGHLFFIAVSARWFFHKK
jgi:hypothetical protein